MSDRDPNHPRHDDAGHDAAHSHTAGSKPRNNSAIMLGAAAVLVVVLAFLFLGGDDSQTPEEVGTSTTDVIEPDATGGAPELEANEAGTEADPAIDDDPAPAD